MRASVAILAAVLALGAAAGCIGDTTSDAGDEDLESSQAEANRTAVERQPADVHVVHDFVEGGAEATFEVENGTVAEERAVYFGGPNTPGPVAPCAFLGDARIVVEDPSGDVAFEAVAGGGNVQGVSGEECKISGEGSTGTTLLEPGTWTVTFEGQAVGTGHVLLQD